MVFVMAVTPVHMHHHHHAMGEISFVLMAHFFGMYGCSFLTGAFADRFGRAAAIGVGSAVLLVSCLLGAFSQGYAGLLAALFLLGLGWNFCFLSGTALVADTLKAVADKGRIQGRADAFVSVGSAAAGFSSGFCLERIGFRGMATVGCVLAVLPLVLMLLWKLPSRQAD
jgi:MFS family permease